MKHIEDEILDLYLHDECEDATEIEAHLAECSKCRAMLNSMKAFHVSIKSEYASEPSSLFVDAVMQRVEPVNSRAPRRVGLFVMLREWGLQGSAIACSLFIMWIYSASQPATDLTYLLENAEVSELESEIFAFNPTSEFIVEEYL